MLPLLLFSLTALAQSSDAIVPLTYTTSVPEVQKERLNKDLLLLNTIPLKDSSGEFQAIFKVPDLSNATAKKWLADRAHYIIADEDPLDDSTLHSLGDAQYPYPDELPELVAGTDEESDSGIVMSNMGGLMYLLGKQNQSKIAFDMVGVGSIPVQSPRVGIFRIGRGLFMPLSEDLPAESINDFVHSIFRLGTLFHEARHGDGHGKSMLFVHTMCPPGHDYDGVTACDTPANGAYRTGALFVRAVKEGCDLCMAGQKDSLDVLIADFENRIISPLKDGTVGPAQAGIPGSSLCAQLKEMEVVAPFCDEKPAPGNVIMWEDAPESL